VIVIRRRVAPRIRQKHLLVLLGALAVVGAGVAAWAYWTASATAGSHGAAAAATVNQGATPTASASASIGREVEVGWGATTLSNGAAVDGYLVRRYPSGGGAATISPVGTCEGTVTGTACVEDDVPAGTWRYTVTPVVGANWRGAESLASGVVTVAPATLTVDGSPFGDAAFTPSIATTTGAITGFSGVGTGGHGEDVDYLLDGSTPLTGSPTFVGTDGAAAITSLEIPKSAGDGPHTVSALGNASYFPSQASAGIVIDTTAPTLDASISPAANGAGWNNTSPVQVSLAADDGAGSGVGQIRYTTDGSDPMTSGTAQVYGGTPLEVTAQGTTTVRSLAFDLAGNPSNPNTRVVKLDTDAPANELSLSNVTGGAFLNGSTVYYSGAASGSFTLTNAVADSLSGPASSATAALTGTTSGWSHSSSSVTTPAGGPYVSDAFDWTAGTSSSPSETVTGADVADNPSMTTLTFTNDTTAPSGGALTVNGTAANAAGTTTSFDTDGSFTIGTRTDYSTDTGSGVASSTLVRTEATLTNNVCGTFGSPVTIPGNPAQSGLAAGCYKFTLTGTDNVGNSASVATTVKVDSVAPSTTDNTASIGNAWRNTNTTVTLTPTDSGTNVANTYYTTDGSTPTTSSSQGTSVALTTTGVYTVRYFSVDNAGNAEAVQTAGTQIRIDKTLPTNALSMTGATGAFLNGTTLYYKNNAAGSFQLVNTVTDAHSGPNSATFPNVTASGWTHPAQTVNTPTGGPYTSSTYSWNSGAGNPSGAQAAFTSTDVAGNTSANTSLTFTNDTTAPSAPVVTFPAASGRYNTVTWNAGCASAICGTASDAASGAGKVEVSVRQGSGNYWDGSSFSSAGQVFNLASGTTSWSYGMAGASFPADGSYTVSVRTTDNVGNLSSITSTTFTIDRAAPAISTVTLQNGGGGNVAGRIEQSDSIIVTFSERMSVASLCSTWSNDAGNQSLNSNGDVAITVTDGSGATNDSLTVTSGTCTFNFGSIDLGSNAYASGGPLTFSGNGSNRSSIAWNASTFQLTITLGSKGGAGTQGTVASSTPVHTASAAATDSAGNAIGNSPFTLPTGQKF
jgi:hypothetical protein